MKRVIDLLKSNQRIIKWYIVINLVINAGLFIAYKNYEMVQSCYLDSFCIFVDSMMMFTVPLSILVVILLVRNEMHIDIMVRYCKLSKVWKQIVIDIIGITILQSVILVLLVVLEGFMISEGSFNWMEKTSLYHMHMGDTISDVSIIKVLFISLIGDFLVISIYSMICILLVWHTKSYMFAYIVTFCMASLEGISDSPLYVRYSASYYVVSKPFSEFAISALIVIVFGMMIYGFGFIGLRRKEFLAKSND